MAHVFIVNKDTLKYHLQYLFAGTGAKDLKLDFLQNSENNNVKCEKLLCSMLADVSRIKVGDKILFYLQATKDYEGMFFGSFEATSTAYIDNDNYPEELSKYKSLPFRIRIKPSLVFPYGVTERNCLDSLQGIEHPYQMCWSLIYRKLKGNRGCTMITDYEYNFLMDKIKNANNNKSLNGQNFSFDDENNKIINIDKKYIYNHKQTSIDITNRLLFKMKKHSAFEVHLQTYILQNIEKPSLLNSLLGNTLEIKWIGNEVSCGVGMQSIDIMIIQEDKNTVFINVLELKDGSILSEKNISNQIQKYINWIQDYISPTYTKKVIIQPIIIAQKINRKFDKSIKYMKDVKDKLNLQNLKYIDFYLDEKQQLNFENEII